MKQYVTDYMTPEVIIEIMDCENILCASNAHEGSMENVEITHGEW